MEWRYYYMDDHTRTIFYTPIEQEDRHDLIFMGMSQNPDPRMPVAVWTQDDPTPRGYKIKPLP